MHGGVSNKKLNQKLLNIFNQLESNSNLLNDHNFIKRIKERLQAKTDPNTQNKDGKTLLHYAAENNCLQVIKFLLQKGADQNVRDQSGKTPSDYVTEPNCLKAIKDLGCSSNDKTTCTKLSDPDSDKDQCYYSDGSCENEGNSTTPDGSVDDCSNSSGDDSQIESVKLSDCNTEEGSRENEENPAKSPDNGNRTFTDQQTSNSPDSDRDSEDSSDCGDEDILSQRDKNISRLNNLACESIVNKSKQTHEYDFKAKINNGYFCIEYPQDSIIEPVKILNNEKAKELNLKGGILKIGESIVRVESVDGKRNYTDILKGGIEMSFTTEVGEISIYLSPSKKDGNKIEVEIDKGSEARLNELKAKKKSLGENCLLGGKNVLEAIKDKGFERNGNVPTESIETIKDVPSTDLTQARLQQEKKAIV